MATAIPAPPFPEDEFDGSDLAISFGDTSPLEVMDVQVEVVDDAPTPKMVNQYIMGEVLGEGAYGKVREAVDSKTLRRVAIKKINLHRLRKQPHAEERLKVEITTLRKLNHPNVVDLLEVIREVERKRIYIVLERCSVTLEHILMSTPDKRLTESEAHKYFVQIVEGLEYIHGQGIVHKDIKPANILTSTDGTVKIADFGTAEVLDPFNQVDACSTRVGSPAFQPPEIAGGAPGSRAYGSKIDVWACGITLFYLITGKVPFTGDTMYELFQNISSCPVVIPDYVSEDAAELIRGMLESSPERRWTMEVIKKHSWFATRRDTSQPSTPYTNTKKNSLLPIIQQMHPHSHNDLQAAAEEAEGSRKRQRPNEGKSDCTVL